MDIQESLGLPRRFEATHAPLFRPGRLMGKLCAVVGIPGCVVNRSWDQLSMREPVAPQLIRHYVFAWLNAMHYPYTIEETLSGLRISPRLQKHIDHLTVLIDRTP